VLGRGLRAGTGIMLWFCSTFIPICIFGFIFNFMPITIFFTMIVTPIHSPPVSIIITIITRYFCIDRIEQKRTEQTRKEHNKNNKNRKEHDK
jgi:phosphate/sulfate permease